MAIYYIISNISNLDSESHVKDVADDFGAKQEEKSYLPNIEMNDDQHEIKEDKKYEEDGISKGSKNYKVVKHNSN